jgi:hypothetical protein
LAQSDPASENCPGVIRFLNIVVVDYFHFVSQQMTFLECATCRIPFVWTQCIGKVETKLIPNFALGGREVLKAYLNRLALAQLPPEAVKPETAFSSASSIR